MCIETARDIQRRYHERDLLGCVHVGLAHDFLNNLGAGMAARQA